MKPAILFKALIWSFTVLCLSRVATAQPPQKPGNPGQMVEGLSGNGMFCATQDWITLQQDPEFKTREAEMNRKILNALRPLSNDTLIIPVVFHIIINNPWGITDQTIRDGLQDLNDAFAKKGIYAGSKGVDTKIRFCLAQTDPSGGITPGITRTLSFYGNNLNVSNEDARLKNLIQWDPTRYVNIWLIPRIHHESFAQFECGVWTRLGTGGYATMPPGGGALDGIVITGFSTLLAHEMGHYLGLYHTFEAGCNNWDCEITGDRVCDTPPDSRVKNSFSCTSPDNSCNTDTLSAYSKGNFTTDVPDQISNFMDYGNESCKNQFTDGQAKRMHAAIQTQRPGLLQPKCDPPCAEIINALFDRDNYYPLPGQTVQFTNMSTGASKYEWLLNDVVVATSLNYSQSFAAPGKYKVTLKAYNNNAACFGAYTGYVIVTCGVAARFYADKRIIASRTGVYTDSVQFTNTSVNATAYRWLMRSSTGMPEQEVSTGKDFRYVFPAPGIYSIRLIATNGTCTDTTGYYSVSVDEPTQDGVPVMWSVDCYDETKVRVSFYLCNNGYATLPANLPVSFYDANPRQAGARKIGATFFTTQAIAGRCCGFIYTRILDVGSKGLNQLYLVFNDSGNAVPVSFSNTAVGERDYNNNFASSSNFSFRVAASPPAATLEPGDTIALRVVAGPGSVNRYQWSPAYNLTCSSCPRPDLVADTTAIKQVVAVSNYGCTDTGYVKIEVPPYNDFSISIEEAQCALNDSIHIAFTLYNAFKRGVLPAGLTVRFYQGDPRQPGAVALAPSFVLADTILAKSFAFTTRIAARFEGRLYAVVNDNGAPMPVVLPNTLIEEKTYANNVTYLDYSAARVMLQPADTILLRGASFAPSITNTIYNASSTQWFSGQGYQLSCVNCASPSVTVFASDTLRMQTANQYGCLIQGKLPVRILPPDFTVEVLSTACLTNRTTRISFRLCMNNNYDSVFKGVPVTFYENDPATGSAGILAPVFITPAKQGPACQVYTHTMATPATGQLYLQVNDRGVAATPGPDWVFEETTYTNNNIQAIHYRPYGVVVRPADTTITRLENVQLLLQSQGGTTTQATWKPAQFLSCTQCFAPVVTPSYTTDYLVVTRNENQCTDTAYATVRTVATGDVFIPSGFTPNGDGKNDRFYVMTGPSVERVSNMLIANRWGEKVFEAKQIAANDPRFGWDGNHRGVPAPPAAYVYAVTVTYRDGTEKILKGTVVLVR